AMMALDPRLAPNGISDLRHVADTLHKEGIALVLDVVFNHTGESDQFGPVLSMRGLDNALYYRHHADEPGALVNDTGTGNTLAVDRAPVRDLFMDAMRHFVSVGGVDGFRFDLCTVLGRTDKGFSPHAPLFEAIRHDAVLADAILVAEPWDTGPGGYQLGNFPPQFLEWNDRFRDDVRRFWRGDAHTLSSLATRLAGSSDYFSKAATNTRSVNFLAAHDGFTLADLTSYKRKHNGPNGENDRDGHSENFSWNHGVEGATADPTIRTKRRDDVKALLALLFVSRGTPLLCAGDEFGRTQKGNNNAYAQDNETTWLNWATRDTALEDFVAALSALRQKHPALLSTKLLYGAAPPGFPEPDILWFRADGAPMQNTDWEDGENRFLGMALSLPPLGKQGADHVAVLVNRSEGRVNALLPSLAKGKAWSCALASKPVSHDLGHWSMPAHSVAVFEVGKA
ncbi:MAG: alpha-amylase family glycosyl hydrolase, partial [Rhizobiaceae bacterium]